MDKKEPCEHPVKQIETYEYIYHAYAKCHKCKKYFTEPQIKRALHLTYGKSLQKKRG
jgi:hypothetical protein